MRRPVDETDPLARGDRPDLRPYRRANAVLFFGGLVLLAALRLADVGEEFEGVQLFGHRLPETCAHKRMTGEECSSCGLTRSVVSAFDGEWDQARSFHRSGPAIAAFLLLQVVLRGLFALRGFARHWKWDVAATALSILVCFGELILQLPRPIP